MSFFVRKWHHFHVVYFCPQVWFLLMSLFRRKFVFIFFHRHFRESKVWNGGSYCCTRHRQFRTHTHTHTCTRTRIHPHPHSEIAQNKRRTNEQTHTTIYTTIHTGAWILHSRWSSKRVRSERILQPVLPTPPIFFPPSSLSRGRRPHDFFLQKKNS